MLALSGGAANGAFTAGYLHELLGMREAALALPRAGETAEERLQRVARYEREYHFGGAVSTSVGSLAALPVDIYFTDDPEAREHALDLLARRFVVDEWDLLCANDGLVLELFLGETKGMLQFQPLVNELLRKDLDPWRDAMLDNAFIRIATAVDVNRNLTVGLDERLCRALDGAERSACVHSAVLASITEPVLANPVCEVYSGLADDPAHAGTWLDGGLRTGTPITWAELVSDGRVLALNTNRLEGVARAGFDNGGQLLFRTVQTFSEQTRLWEVAFASLSRGERQWGVGETCHWLAAESLAGVEETDCAALWEGAPAEPAAVAHVGEGPALVRPGGDVVRAPIPSPTLARRQFSLPGFAGRMAAAPLAPMPMNLAPTEAVAVQGPVGPRPVADQPVGGGVLSVYVPDTLPPELVAAGYTFDPDVTRQLYEWGALTFLRTHPLVFRHLEWEDLAASADWAELARYVEEQTALHAAELARLEEAWREEMKDPADYMAMKRRELADNLKKCPVASERKSCVDVRP